MTVAYLGLGGNVGDVIGSMSGALQQLDRHDLIKVLSVSSIYRTPPWGLEDQDWFHNACASLQTKLQPLELLEECQKIEQTYKRVREIRWGPRTLDLDLLLYGDEEIDHVDLKVPHPEMPNRNFVLIPLYEIAPQLTIPGMGAIDELITKLDTGGLERIDGS